ncbi:hypothetical protein ISR94_02650 [Candidatus Microgenomates bacterium]|nr:hypothetical protein [Candidatus Microgenomates bacterium]
MKSKTNILKDNEKVGVSKVTTSVTFWRTVGIVMFGLFVFFQLFSVNIKPKFKLPGGLVGGLVDKNDTEVDTDILQKAVIPENGVELPITWGDLGATMVEDGVIDEVKFRELFPEGFDEQEERMLVGGNNEKITMTEQNSRYMLDMLWAFGLANKNEILTSGEMTSEQYGGDASKFASTGGWSLSRGNVMNHYSMHPYVVLDADQQDLVDKVSLNIFRPCCGNSTHFPDCNHGMAMLGLLELMAANNVDEKQMYQVALKVNSYWFPQTYIDLAVYFEEQGQKWNDVDPKLVLGQEYSSGQGYAQTRKKIISLPTPAAGGGGCGV